jgi:DNA-binding winged helix-turn-helix (wHTH) protein/TolB-like protein
MGLKVPELFMDKRFYTFDSFCLDPVERRLSSGEDRIPLAHAHFDVLLILVQRAGEDVTKEELWKVWGNGRGNDALLNTAIHKVREALGDDAKNPRYIMTVPNKGYRFLAKVELCNDRPLSLGSPAPVPALSKEAGSNLRPANGSSLTKPRETWWEWLTGGMWRDLREGLGLIKEGFDTFFDAMSEAWNSGIGEGGSKVLRGFRKMWLPLIIVVAIIVLVWYLLKDRSASVKWAILSVALVLVVLEIVRRWKRRPPIRKMRSIAILPLKNQNGSGSHPEFAQETTDTIIRDLTKLEFLRVCNASDESNLSIRDIARKLRVKGVMQGNVEWLGERVRVNVEIVGWDGVTFLGKESFEEKFSDSVTTRNAISQQIVDWLLHRMKKKPRTR